MTQTVCWPPAGRDLARARMLSQGLVMPGSLFPADDPAAVMRAFGAMQGQDGPGVIASLALRSGCGSSRVHDAFENGDVVRGYPMRSTVFAVLAEDLLWMTQLCTPQGEQRQRSRLIAIGMPGEIIDRAVTVFDDAASGSAGITREELRDRWRTAGIDDSRATLYRLVKYLLIAGIAAYGPVHGSHSQVVSAQTWLPAGTDMEGVFNGDRVAAASELFARYAATHGPVTEADFAWWSKLALREIRPAIEGAVKAGRVEASATGAIEEPVRYWAPGLPDLFATLGRDADAPMLLPGFDELILGYQDRLYVMTAAQHERLVPNNNGVFRASALAGARVVGHWRRKGSGRRRTLDLEPYANISEARMRRFERAFSAFPFSRE